MFLELTEALDCPDCRSGFGLVAFVDEAQDGRVVEGWLGCPMCEIQIPIEAGSMNFLSSSVEPESATIESTSASVDPTRATRVAAAAEMGADGSVDFNTIEDTAVRLAALLGLSEQRGIMVLLGFGLADYALPIVRFGERVEVVVWMEPESPSLLSQDELAEGINPMRATRDRPWPIRMNSLHGLALRGPALPQQEEATRCVRPGGRLVILDPTQEDVEGFASGAFEELARDDTTWVGERR